MVRTRSSKSSAARGLLLWLPVLAGCTLVLWTFRDVLHEAHISLAYLLVVLGGSARHGRKVGAVLSVLAFTVFNFFLLPPLYTLTIEDPLDWGILIAFLITGGVAAELLHRSRRATDLAEERAREIDRLSALGAQSLSVPSSADALADTARMIGEQLRAPLVEVIAVEASGERRVLARTSTGGPGVDPILSRRVVEEDRIVGVGLDGVVHVGGRGVELSEFLDHNSSNASVLAPLRVRDRAIGVLHLSDPSGLHLDGVGGAFADTLTYYAALALERARLAEEAQHVASLREADRLKDALLASVSHDLRTPLTTIRALGSEIRRSGDERAAVIEEHAERLNKMVTDLLALSRIRAGGLPIEPEIVPAEDLVGATLESLRGVGGADRIRVTFPPDGSVVIGRFDFVQTLRALSNLLDNALRHGGCGAVDLEVCEESSSVVFRVLDRGPGIAAGDLEHVFEPFFRGDSASGAAGGTGLGLAIAKSIAEAHGGTLGYRSRPGGGSIFELRLPAEALGPLR